MAAGGDPEAKHSSVELMPRMCTALRGRGSPEGPSCFRGISALPPEKAALGCPLWKRAPPFAPSGNGWTIKM